MKIKKILFQKKFNYKNFMDSVLYKMKNKKNF